MGEVFGPACRCSALERRRLVWPVPESGRRAGLGACSATGGSRRGCGAVGWATPPASSATAVASQVSDAVGPLPEHSRHSPSARGGLQKRQRRHQVSWRGGPTRGLPRGVHGLSWAAAAACCCCCCCCCCCSLHTGRPDLACAARASARGCAALMCRRQARATERMGAKEAARWWVVVTTRFGLYVAHSTPCAGRHARAHACTHEAVGLPADGRAAALLLTGLGPWDTSSRRRNERHRNRGSSWIVIGPTAGDSLLSGESAAEGSAEPGAARELSRWSLGIPGSLLNPMLVGPALRAVLRGSDGPWRIQGGMNEPWAHCHPDSP